MKRLRGGVWLLAVMLLFDLISDISSVPAYKSFDYDFAYHSEEQYGDEDPNEPAEHQGNEACFLRSLQHVRVKPKSYYYAKTLLN